MDKKCEQLTYKAFIVFFDFLAIAFISGVTRELSLFGVTPATIDTEKSALKNIKIGTKDYKLEGHKLREKK